MIAADTRAETGRGSSATSGTAAAAKVEQPLWLRTVRHTLCILALMWTGIINGQPFFFDDSTNYIRAADMALHVASGKQISTVWTERYRTELSPETARNRTGRDEALHAPTVNSVKNGLVMSGRSPYIGALMFAGWLTGWFWPFVFLQAAIAYCLIVMTLRRFQLDSTRIVVGTVALLAAVTSLPTYNSLLLADGFSSFGILAFLLLADPGKLKRYEIVFLSSVMAMFVLSHLTHLMMLFGMMGAAFFLFAVRWSRPPARLWLSAVACVVIGVVGIQLTAVATKAALGREPQLLPLLTARFYADGPGREYIRFGCDGNRFQVCRLPIQNPVNNTGWLFDTNPKRAAYMLGSPEQRRVMGEEDVSFAIAVLKAYPLQQMTASAMNVVKQLVIFDYTGLNRGCDDDANCWESLPPAVKASFDDSLGGRNLWPEALMDAVLKVFVVISLLAIFVFMRGLRVRDMVAFDRLKNFLVIGGAGMLVCCAFGGAVADPQYRYQGRLIWLVVFFAIIAGLAWRRSEASEMAVAANGD